MSSGASADTILYNGTVLTVDARSSVADSVAIKRDRILAVGRYQAITPLRGKDTRLIDLEGGTAIPGMIDNHTHQLLAGIDLIPAGKVNIAHCQSIAQIKSLIAARVKGRTPGEWIGTSCMFRGALAEKRFPNRFDLDEVAPDNPVYIFQSGKNIIANSLALKIADINDETPDPTGPDYSAGHIVRDADKHATGHLIAGAGDLARRRWWQAQGQSMQKWDFLHFDQSTYEAAILAQMQVFNAAGITGTRDMGVSIPEMDGYRGIAAKGTATVRTELIVGLPIRYVPLDEAESLIEAYDGPKQGEGNDLAWVGGFKFVLQNDGYWSHSPEKFRRLIRTANRLGWRLAIHGAAVHDQTGWDRIMEALEEANAERPFFGRRISLEHFIGTRRPEHLQKLRDWGVIIAPNPSLSYFAAGRSYEMHKVMQEVRIAQPSSMTPMEHARHEWGLPIRDWIDSGLKVTGGTDCPATTYDPERPLLGMYAARTQQSLAGVLLHDQTVSPEEALRMWTIDAAYSLFKEDQVGSIEPGKFADITVLTGNPLTSSDEGLLDIRIRRTIMGGRVVYHSAPDADS
ncbi:MAG: amidohydrolase [Steroidobacteraceae bacterium]